MPKVKTRKIVKNRFKITKTGKVMHRTQGARHIRRTKSKARQRRTDKPVVVETTKYSRNIKRLLGKA
jgi:large subunit ribosomal protein L35